MVRIGILIAALAAIGAAPAAAGIHTWNVQEVFSNADGSIQFVELIEGNGTPGETGVGNGSIAGLALSRSHAWSNGAVAPPTTNKSYLIATQSFANLPGAPTPDVIIPAGQIPFFSTAGDTVSFVVYDSWAFGAVPTNGINSLDRTTGVGPNSPKNYAGATGSVNAGQPAPMVPLFDARAIGLLLALLTAAGFATLWMRRARTSA